jgi:tetratricopeptide (TPR) repeat protein
LEDNPESTEALMLLGDCYERTNRLEEALEAYEKVVELKPDSPLDRIKVTHLRKKLAENHEDTSSPQVKRNALLAAAFSALLIVAVGLTLWLASNRAEASEPAQTEIAVNDEPATPYAQGFQVAQNQNPAPAQPAPETTEEAPAENPTDSTPSTGGSGSRTTIPAPRTNRPSPLPNSGGGVLPNVGSSPSLVAPFNPFGDSGTFNLDPEPVEQPDLTPPTPGLDPDPGIVTRPRPSADPDPEPEGPTQRPSIIDIRPSEDNPTRSGGGQTVPDDSGGGGDTQMRAETLVRVARESFMVRDYAKAADLYRQALAAGASRGYTNQRLAQCYEKLGQTGNAISAYQRAIAAFEASGTPQARNAADSCRAAIRLLQG